VINKDYFLVVKMITSLSMLARLSFYSLPVVLEAELDFRQLSIYLGYCAIDGLQVSIFSLRARSHLTFIRLCKKIRRQNLKVRHTSLLTKYYRLDSN
jgi:hypothetical protein